VGRDGVPVHVQREIHEPEADLARRHQACHDVRLLDGREIAATRAFEVGELDDLHEGVRAADDHALGLEAHPGAAVEGDDLGGPGHDPADRAQADDGDDGDDGAEVLRIGLLEARHEGFSTGGRATEQPESYTGGGGGVGVGGAID